MRKKNKLLKNKKVTDFLLDTLLIDFKDINNTERRKAIEDDLFKLLKKEKFVGDHVGNINLIIYRWDNRKVFRVDIIEYSNASNRSYNNMFVIPFDDVNGWKER